jgi:hypothetical protein
VNISKSLTTHGPYDVLLLCTFNSGWYDRADYKIVELRYEGCRMAGNGIVELCPPKILHGYTQLEDSFAGDHFEEIAT